MTNTLNKLTKTIAQWMTRRTAVKLFGITLSSITLLAGALCVTGFGQRSYRLGGGWVGGNPVYTWSVLFAPSDPAGQTAAARPILKYFTGDFAALLNHYGADNLSDATGEVKMVSRDTARWTLISYAQVTPHQPGDPLVNKAIIVSHGTWQFTSENTALLNYTLDVYLPTADVDGDGFPDPGTSPDMIVPTVDTAKRVPIL